MGWKVTSANIFKTPGRNSTESARAVSALPPLPWEEAIAWMCSQRCVQALVFTRAKDAGLIRYDSDRGLWVGVAGSDERGG